MLVAAAASAAPQGANERLSSTLAVEKRGGQERETLEFRATILEQKEGEEPHVCMCRAMLFRVLQMAAQRRAGGVLKIDEIKALRTGWPSEAYQEVLGEMLGLPRNRIQLTSEGLKCESPVVENAWWQIQFTDGKAITVWATPQMLPEEFVKLRAEHKRGKKGPEGKKDPEVKKALQAMKEQQVAKMDCVPLNQLFVVQE